MNTILTTTRQSATAPHASADPRMRAGRIGRAFPAPLDGVIDLAGLWLHRIRTRRALAEMPPERLADLGMDAEAAAAEWAKPFWR